jgi:hypothetical protein
VFFFLQKKVCLILLTGLLLVSCEQPNNGDPPPNDDHPPVDSITIASPADMEKIGVEETHPLSGNYLLANDITLADWLPIGDATIPFTGVFDGNEKKITLNSFDATAVSGKTYLGIFGYVKGSSVVAKAVIKNLAIDSTVNTTSAMASGQAIGLVAGYAELAVIENITLMGTFDFQSEKTIFTGGVAGFISGEGTLVKGSSSSLTMNIVLGSGSGLAGAYNYAGGFVGLFRNGAGIENCHNTGDVIADNAANAVSGQVFTGGIAGGSAYGFITAYQGYIKDSSFTGIVIGRAMGDWTFVGGIAGTICGGTINDIAATTRIERCFVTGTVSTMGTSSGYPYTGGIVGYNYYGALVSQSYFDGEVIAGKSGDYTGGIAGYNSQTLSPNNSRIEDCWSSGTVTGIGNAGGIAGQNQVNTYIRRCYSTAEVSANGGIVGGIAGLNASNMSDGAITACVALNPSITITTGRNIHRIVGNTGTGNLSNNYAWSGMIVTTATSITPAIGHAAADGADCDEKPNQSFYENIGWDFVSVWKMGADGYPQLRWQ